MTKSESKYFNTAARLDRAFLDILAKKDFEYITVKEICEKAKVNRSTFYLHYETLDDLLCESVDYMNNTFLEYMKLNSKAVIATIRTCDVEKLYFLTPEYLTPYLNFIFENRRLFRTALNNAASLRLDKTYGRMFRHVFTPVLERFDVPLQDRAYIMAFYIRGLMAIITEWLNCDCRDSVEQIISIMRQCVLPSKTLKDVF